MSRLIAASSVLALLTACANPDVVDVRKLGDEELSCEQIREEIYEAEKFEDKARDEKGVTGKNVAAALFFWPAMLVTYNNAGEAIEAAKDRKERLTRIGDKKGCKL